jgi:hypothetical protein
MQQFPETGSPATAAVFAYSPGEQQQGGEANAAVKDYYQREAEAAANAPGEHRPGGGAA